MNQIAPVDIVRWQNELMTFEKPSVGGFSATYLKTVNNQESICQGNILHFNTVLKKRREGRLLTAKQHCAGHVSRMQQGKVKPIPCRLPRIVLFAEKAADPPRRVHSCRRQHHRPLVGDE